jgi:NADPH2:quinone reductase
MQAIRLYQFGGPENLIAEEVALPEPGPGQARVKITASGINFIDIYQRMGAYKIPLPSAMGREGAGTVEAVGPEVTGVKVGDRVAYVSVQGSYAEYAIVPVERLVPVPDGVDLTDAAAVMLQGITAHYLAFSTYPIQAQDTVLVHAAAGGVGGLLVQVAKRLGAMVIGTVSTEEKAQVAREAGADHVILYTQTDFEQETKRITGGKGVAVVYDSVAKTTFEQSLNSLKRRGTMVLCGQSSGPAPAIDPQTLNAKGSLYLTRPMLDHYIADRAELLWRAQEVLNWVRDGQLRVRIDSRFPLMQAGVAQAHLASRQAKGKVVLVPA